MPMCTNHKEEGRGGTSRLLCVWRSADGERPAQVASCASGPSSCPLTGLGSSRSKEILGNPALDDSRHPKTRTVGFGQVSE